MTRGRANNRWLLKSSKMRSIRSMYNVIGTSLQCKNARLVGQKYYWILT